MKFKELEQEINIELDKTWDSARFIERRAFITRTMDINAVK